MLLFLDVLSFSLDMKFVLWEDNDNKWYATQATTATLALLKVSCYYYLEDLEHSCSSVYVWLVSDS